ncbi:MAG: lysine transporter LysE [Thermoprotei archaeon]|nr:MAG: lysine transporter LysE [Thermoprotei archaeon]RLG81826.1 MAG: lysine transporter LysE [Thermoprotei archaeon]
MASSLYTLVYLTLMVSPSGALSPRPLTIATIAIGSKQGFKGGLLVALGHMLVELPYIAVLFYFMSQVEAVLTGVFGDLLVASGSLVLFYFAVLLVRDSLRGSWLEGSASSNSSLLRNPVVVGIAFTGLNICFLLWWLSIGFTLISLLAGTGILGILVMYSSHVWMDFLWLGFVAGLARKGLRVMSSKRYKALLLILASLLFLFGTNSLLNRFLKVSIIP